MNLKSLVRRELGEGLTEKELAATVEVSVRTIANILADKLPKHPAIWKKFARYFRMDADILRTGGPPYPKGMFERTERPYHSPAGQMRELPLLDWHQIDQMVMGKEPPRIIHALAIIETTDVAGTRTFSLKVKDHAMQPLFSKGEIIFVNPDLPSEPGHYVVVESEAGRPDRALLRQLKEIDGQVVLHPLNRRYEDLPLTKRQRIWGRVVRLRKNL